MEDHNVMGSGDAETADNGPKKQRQNLKLTTVLLVFVLFSIVASISAVGMAIYFNLRAQALQHGSEQQLTNLAIAATVLERRMSGSVLTWKDDGSLIFQSWAILPFNDTDDVDSVTRVTGQDVSIYGVDQTGSLVLKSTSILGTDGARLSAMELPPDSSITQTVTAGEQYQGELPVNGVGYYGAFLPIGSFDGKPLGAIFVGTPEAALEVAANSVLPTIAVAGGAVIGALGLIAFFLTRVIIRPIPRLARSMSVIANGDYQVQVPFVDLGNEVGSMARAVEIFRENGLRVSQMTEAEAARIVADAEERRRMMTELQAAFGDVVDAAAAGDFSQRVSLEFADSELNALAASVNNLVEMFSRGVNEIGVVLGAMADTDLTKRMSGAYEGEFSTLKHNVNSVADRLADVVGKLRVTSGSLRVATRELLSGANDLSERTTKQAATIEETSAAIEQLAGTVLANAQRALDASGNATEVTRVAEDGGQVMSSATEAMERISGSSAKISNIIGMIDDIAFQTNLLALNASVEAARAGDAGKGFAVVAVEVRRLAQSAAQASAEVKTLIEQSAGEVRAGSRLVSEAADKLKAMLNAIRGNNGLLQSIANDSRDQATAIEEVARAVRTMDEMTQHNAALVEETNAAIEQTEAQASELDQIVDVFQIDRPMEAPVARLRLRKSG